MSTKFYKITKRLEISSFRVKDIHDFSKVLTNPRVNFFMGADRFFSQPCLAKLFLEQMLADSTGTNPWLLYSVFDKSNHLLIGGCGFKISLKNKEAEIFYLFLPTYWGKGIAVEACSAVINGIFRNSTIQKIKALILPENLRAQRVAEKIGFKFINKDKDKPV